MMLLIDQSDRETLLLEVLNHTFHELNAFIEILMGKMPS